VQGQEESVVPVLFHRPLASTTAHCHSISSCRCRGYIRAAGQEGWGFEVSERARSGQPGDGQLVPVLSWAAVALRRAWRSSGPTWVTSPRPSLLSDSVPALCSSFLREAATRSRGKKVSFFLLVVLWGCSVWERGIRDPWGRSCYRYLGTWARSVLPLRVMVSAAAGRWWWRRRQATPEADSCGGKWYLIDWGMWGARSSRGAKTSVVSSFSSLCKPTYSVKKMFTPKLCRRELLLLNKQQMQASLIAFRRVVFVVSRWAQKKHLFNTLVLMVVRMLNTTYLHNNISTAVNSTLVQLYLHVALM
jgi:hypothetical protein